MGNGALAIGPKLPRPSSTLPRLKVRHVSFDGEYWGVSGRTADSVRSERYVVFYRITKNAIEIVRVLDERRDVDAMFENVE